MNREGSSLIELMVSIILFSTLAGALFSLMKDATETSGMQQAQTGASDEARKALAALIPELRQALSSSLSPLPAQRISYRVPIDAGGNGLAIDSKGNLELSAVRTISRDLGDANGDGQTDRQLILRTVEGVRVLANGLYPDEDLNGNGVLDEGEDRNGNGRLDRGLWFAASNGGVQAAVQIQRVYPPERSVTARLEEYVVPRN